MAMSIRTRRVIVGASLVAAGALGTLLILRLLAGDDDENPIRVKNKELRIESEDKEGAWTKVPAASEKWRLNVANRYSATQYVVTAYGANPDPEACKNQLTGTIVEVAYKYPNNAQGQPPETTQTLTFSLVQSGPKTVPLLDSTTPMTEDNSKKVKKLRMSDDKVGGITRLTVKKDLSDAGTSCSFPADRRVAVEICMHNCS